MKRCAVVDQRFSESTEAVLLQNSVTHLRQRIHTSLLIEDIRHKTATEGIRRKRDTSEAYACIYTYLHILRRILVK